jgi:hypothetical protein
MKILNSVIISVFLLTFSCQSIKSQSRLFVNNKFGVNSSYALSTVKSLTFTSGHFIVNKIDGSPDTYTLANIRSLNFLKDESTLISHSQPKGEKKFFLSPNPVMNHINIQFKSESFSKVNIQIIDMQGRIVAIENHDCQVGLNILTIPASQLQHGFYFCRLQNDNEFEFRKFLKY